MIILMSLFFILNAAQEAYTFFCSDTNNSPKNTETMSWNSTVDFQPVAAPNDINLAYPWLIQLQNIIFIIACAISVVFLVMIYSYLHNMNSVKECILVHLYKDFVTIMIISRIWLVMKGIVAIFTISELQHQAIMSQLTAKILSFSFIALANFTLMILNIIGALRLYMTKTMVLDPPMPWGIDDEFGIKIIRLIAGGISIGYPLMLFPFEIYPKVYYDFLNQTHPRTSSCYVIPCIVQLLVFLTSMLVEKFHQKKGLQEISPNIPKQVNYFVLVIILMYTFILFEVSVQLLNPNTRWTVIQTLATFLSVTTPLAVILKSEKLSTYSTKFVKEKYEDAFILSIYVVPVILSFGMYCFLYVLYWILNI